MPKVFPSPLPEEIRNDLRRSAECRIYDLFSEQLDSSYSVFYSSPWLGTTETGGEIDGEADFVVAHPDKGILVIEVKGGRIRIDENNQWFSKDRFDITYEIKNPVGQARASKHQLYKKLKDSNKLGGRWITLRHGVILPDVGKEKKILRPDMPPDIFVFGDDLIHLKQWVDSRFASSEEDHGREESPLGVDGISALQDLLARPIEFRVPAGLDVQKDLKTIELLSKEQYWTIRDLQNNHRMTIAGAAGTGKTLLAVHKATLLADEEKRVLLLCFNRALSIRLKKLMGDSPWINCSSFHQFFATCLTQAGMKVPERDNSYTSDMLIESFVKAGLEEYDAVIVDEGQDFRPEWLAMLEMLLKNTRDGVFYIFYDGNQNVMSRENSYIDSMPVSYHLHRNYRNTKRIFEKAEKYYSGEPTLAVGPEGMEVALHRLDNLDTVGSVLAERIGSLTHNENVRPEEITVLAADATEVRKISRGSRIGQHHTVSAEVEQAGAVTLDSVRRFKGLESPVVLLVLSGVSQEDDELLYTGITRAQSLLEIFGPERIIRKIR